MTDTRKTDRELAAILRQAEELANPWRVAWMTKPSWYADYPSILYKRPYIRPTREMLERVGLPQEYIDRYLSQPLKHFEISYDEVLKYRSDEETHKRICREKTIHE